VDGDGGGEGGCGVQTVRAGGGDMRAPFDGLSSNRGDGAHTPDGASAERVSQKPSPGDGAAQ
jgi:hypothetical protein